MKCFQGYGSGGAAIVTLRFSFLSLTHLGVHGQASLLHSLSPYPGLMLSWDLLDEFREGQSADSPQPLCSLHWQRCELCPHKDGALKRTDNGGEGNPERLLRSARPHPHPKQVWGGGWLPLFWLVQERHGCRGQSIAWCWGQWGLVLLSC